MEEAISRYEVMGKSNGKLKDLAAIFEKEPAPKNIAIFIGIPDPDSIGAGLGMRALLNKICGASCDLIYSGEISHPQNKTLINVLDINLIHIDEILASAERRIDEYYEKFVFVDCTPRDKWAKDLLISVVIDHHKVSYDEAEFIDIRQVGSCCSLVLSYMREAGIEFEDDEDGEMSKVSTAMLFGVKTDTQDLMSENVTNLDFEAYQYLVKYVSKTELEPIIHYQLPAYYFEIRRRLEEVENSQVHSAFYVGGVGILSAARRDALPMLADERVRMEGVTTAIIFALVDNCLEASVRSTNAAVDVNTFCHQIFGKGFSGGKQGAGAAKVPLGVLSVDSLPEDLKEEAWAVYRKVVMTKIIRVCGSE